MKKELLTALLPLVGSAAFAEQKPNIILIMTDQHRFDYIGAVNDKVITPNLDRLCREGYRFENGYSSTPSSTPARAALLTGMSPWHHGLMGYSGAILENYKYEMPRMLHDAGYYTAAVGKMHWTPQRNRHGLDELYVDESGRVENPDFVSDYRQWFAKVAPGINPDSLGIGWNDHAAGIYPLADSLHPTYWTAQKSIEVLKSIDKSSPFFLKVSFARPHSPYDPPKQYYDRYKGCNQTAPAIGEWSESFGKYPHSASAAYGDYTPEYAVNSRNHYAASVTFIDEQIGRIIDELKKEGVYDNSIIIFISDHGDMLGDHHHWRKTYPYEGSTHIPFIVKMPESIKCRLKPGTPVEALAEIRDVLPTFLHVAGVAIPEEMDGKSLTEPITKGKKADWRAYIDLEHTECYRPKSSWVALTDAHTKYVWNYSAGTEELYDLQNDPYETRNLIGDSRYESTLSSWRERMKQHLSERGETFVKENELQIRKAILKSPNFKEYNR